MHHLTLLPATAKFLTVFLAVVAAPTAVRCQEASKPSACSLALGAVSALYSSGRWNRCKTLRRQSFV